MKNPVQARIEREINGYDVVLFMKGTPVFPQCGFSAVMVQVLSHLGVKFKGIDVLSDPALRQGIKAFSDWPTVPQLYVKGEFIGGCDIVREMFETGELAQFLAARGMLVPFRPDRFVTLLILRGCSCACAASRISRSASALPARSSPIG
jgi:monothiol glutaredoxin